MNLKSLAIMSEPVVVAAIFARGGSKGVLGKNIRQLGGRPLIAHSVECALQVPGLHRVIVSTDDPVIAAAALAAGAEVPFLRPIELARDDSPEWLAWRHAVEFLRQETGGQGVDVMLSVPTTSPLRAPQDVRACLERLLDSQADVCLTVCEASRNPYFNMVSFLPEGQVKLVMADSGITRRQDAPEVFDITTVAYAVRADFVLSAASMLDGRTTAVVIPRERAIDIDSELDFEMAEFLWCRRLRQ